MSTGSWAEYAAAMPDMAAAGRGLLHQFGVGLGYLATVRADGGPASIRCARMSWATTSGCSSFADSPKRGDLDRDGRYSLHTFSAPDTDDSFYVTGRAERQDDRRDACPRSSGLQVACRRR